MNKQLLKRLEDLVSAITRGEYSKCRDMERMACGTDCSQDEARFLESLGLMSVKLEAREYAIEQHLEELEARNAELLKEKKKNSFFSMVFVSLFLAISLYVFLVILARNLDWQVHDSARIVEAIFLSVTLLIIKKSGLSFADLGVTFSGGVQSVRFMLPGTLTAIFAMVVLKGMLILLEFCGPNEPLVVMDNFDLLFVLYLPVAFFQEFMARGVIQTAFESVLSGANARFWAIMTSSALFGLVHIQLSVGVAFASFVCSLYWGYLYTKKRSLAGVGLSHFLIGDMAYVLGFWDYLYII